MASTQRLTLTEVASLIGRKSGREAPIWKLRRVVDILESQQKLEVHRVGNYRTIADTDVGVVTQELKRIGWFNREVAPC